MAREYSTKRSSRHRNSAPHQFLVIVVTFLLGYLTASFIDIQTIGHWMNTQVLASHEAKKQPVKAETTHAQIPPKPKFEFYTLLANEKTSAGTSSASHPTHAANPAYAPAKAAVASSTALVKPNTQHQAAAVKIAEAKPVISSANKGSYMVQVAAFKVQQDAEHMKGLLTLKGFNVMVMPVAQARGNWFRVIVGPYSNRVLAQKAQITLAKNEHLKGMIISG